MSAPAPATAPRPQHRLWRWLGWGLLLPALLLTALLAGLGWWARQPGSLAAVLIRLPALLPAGYQLQTREVDGSIAAGGRIGQLDWSQPGLRVQIDQLDVRWSAPALWQGRLELPVLHAARVRIDDQRPSGPGGPPTDLRLPLPIQVEVMAEIDQFQLRQGRQTLPLSHLGGRYRYDGHAHQLDAAHGQLAQGRYQGNARLQAQAPFQLQADASGQIASPAPGPLLQLRAQARGPLARLQLSADLEPAQPGPARASAPQAHLSALLQPWQAQPLPQAEGRWQQLNPAAFWPQAPQAQLSGQVQARPGDAPGQWQIRLSLDNPASGPWDQGRLPLAQLALQAEQHGAHWRLTQLQARAAGGQVRGSAQFDLPAPPALPQAWQAALQLEHLDLSHLDRRWASLPLSGQLSASQQPGQPLQFQADLAADGAPARPDIRQMLLQLRRLVARGSWSGDVLTLAQIDLRTADAQLQGQGHWQRSSRAGGGQLHLQAPGLEARLDGGLSRTQGAGHARLTLSDAGRTSQWLNRWPGLTLPELRGNAAFDGQWQGGWGDPGHLQWQATLEVPLLAPARADPPWRVRALHAELGGPASQAHLSLSSLGDWQGHPVQASTQARLRLTPGAWQAELAALQIQLPLQPGQLPWRVELAQPVQLDARNGSVHLGPGSLQLHSPAQDSAQLRWQASTWSGASAWDTQGQIEHIPLAWVAALGGPTLAQAGLRGDLQLGGPWSARASPDLHLHATLSRSSGDIALQPDDERAAPFSAGVREARLDVQADGPRLSAQLRWDSERAGQAQLSASTELQAGAQGWTWPDQAPIRAQVRAQLPKVGLWSVLAPPGWRLRGTLDANASLGGTRAQPVWHGSLQADDLAVRSVAEGIEFGQGRLRATLDGQRLTIDDCSLKGASGAGGNGGQLSARGSVLWQPGPDSSDSPLHSLHMALQVQLQQLRVSARADQRLAVSGQLDARLEQARLRLRGQLRADQALFILADDSAPRLGEDVVVRGQPVYAPAPVAARGGIPVQPDVQLQLDLGNDFALRGRGLDTRLTGQLTLSSSGTPLKPLLNGEIHTVGGSYQAYGQHLDIDTGLLRFTGPYDNPGLEVLAIRPNLSQKVGVHVTGTVLLPRVRLWAESADLTDADKLAWLVLGRAAANGGGESAMLQQAALALLGGNGPGLAGNVARALGLDELSLRGPATQSDGTTSAATVTLGKRLSRQFYVAYERSLAGTLGTFYIFYDLSRRFTLRAQAGQQSAADLIFTLRYD